MLKVAKLVSGEFVIGKLVDMNLTNVMTIRFNANRATGQITNELIPYMAPLSMSLGKMISTTKAIVIEDASQELQIQYLEILKNMIAVIKGKQDGKDSNGQDAIPEPNKAAPTKIEKTSGDS